MKIIQFTIVIFIIVIMLYLLAGDKACRESGGKYVRDLFWYECIKG